MFLTKLINSLTDSEFDAAMERMENGEFMQNQVIDPLNDGKSRLVLIDWWGNDKAIVEDARTSYGKVRSDEFTDKDEKLLKYLIEHQHTSPFRGSGLKLQVKAPLFICRQWWKHVVASANIEEQVGWNEQSFRYTQPELEFYIPAEFRAQSSSNKQSSEGVVNNPNCRNVYELTLQTTAVSYRNLILAGVCREQARAILPPAIYTTWVWTASLQTILHFIGLRKGKGAQQEIAAYAEAIEDIVSVHFPKTLEVFRDLGYQGF